MSMSVAHHDYNQEERCEWNFKKRTRQYKSADGEWHAIFNKQKSAVTLESPYYISHFCISLWINNTQPNLKHSLWNKTKRDLSIIMSNEKSAVLRSKNKDLWTRKKNAVGAQIFHQSLSRKIKQNMETSHWVGVCIPGWSPSSGLERPSPKLLQVLGPVLSLCGLYFSSRSPFNSISIGSSFPPTIQENASPS